MLKSKGFYDIINAISERVSRSRVVSWNGIDDEDRFAWAEIIADALLSTGQRFIVP